MPVTASIETSYWGNRTPQDSCSPAPKLIWSYWHDDATPPSVQMARRSWAIFAPEYEVRILSRSNVEEVLGPMPRRIAKRNHAAISDWVRLEALKQSGGLWMDASIVLFEPIEAILPKESKAGHHPFMYYNRRWSNNKESPMLESWLILAPPNSELVRLWAREYKRATWARTAYRRIMGAIFRRRILQNYPDFSYFTVFAALQVALLKNRNLIVRMADSELAPYLLHHRFAYDPVGISTALMSGETDGVPAVKLTNGDRPFIDAALSGGRIARSSPLAKLLSD